MKKNLMFMFIVISLTVEAQLGSFRLGQVSFSAGTLIDRYYVYSLIINNATIDTKLMLISHS